MKPIITIPSYNRPDSKIFDKLIPIRLEKFVFVRKNQYEDYVHLQEKNFRVITIPTSIEEIGKTRRYIVYWCQKHGYKWAFMFDDDISKVECLGRKPDGTWNSKRILAGSQTPPRFETEALKLWYTLAKRHEICLSSPNHRAYDRFNHGYNIRINKSAPIQCVLMYIPTITAVGSYKNSRKIGNEDLYIIYQLMTQGYKVGKIGLIEYDCAAMGNIEDGTSDSFQEKYERFVQCFQENVCNNPDLIGVKTTSTGVPSIQFKWKNWGGYTINLEDDNE